MRSFLEKGEEKSLYIGATPAHSPASDPVTFSLPGSTMRLALVASLVCFADALLLPNLAPLFSVFPSPRQIPLMASASPHHAPLLRPSNIAGMSPTRYIVVLSDRLSFAEVADFRSLFLRLHASSIADLLDKPLVPDFFSVHSLNGFVSHLSPLLVDVLRSDPRVRFVEHDATFHLTDAPQSPEIQPDATWGLDRVSHRENSGTKSLQYLYNADAGLGVNAYVIDTGIKVEHAQFGSRAKWGSAIAFPRVRIDAHGHGTHCAGTIGALDYGLSKNVNLIAVGVMTPLGTGSTSDIIKGLEFVVSDHKANVAARKKGFKGLVINMSIGGEVLEALDLAVNAAVSAGLHIAVAAGNDNADACKYSPARASGPVTVGAMGPDDTIAPFSNWGSCVDLFAPGVDIKSTFTWSDTTVMSGTLMASPHVAGLLTYFLSLSPDVSSEYGLASAIDPASLKRRLLLFATKDVIKNLKNDGSPNLLGYNGAGGDLAKFWQPTEV